MIYTIEASKQFQKQMSKLDKYTQVLIKGWITRNLVNCENPRQFGKLLTGNHVRYWQYRIGDYRIICEIDDNKCVIVAISNRKEIYK